MVFRNLKTIVAIDVETTGLNPSKDRIVSLAMIRADLSNASLTEEGSDLNAKFMYLEFDPEVPIPAAASRVHGITNEKVAGEPAFAEKAGEIREFISDYPIIAHNMKFDGDFLQNSLLRADVDGISSNPRHCTMLATHDRACRLLGRNVKWPKLVEAGKYAGVVLEQDNVHNALQDAMGALQLAIGLKCTRIEGTKVVLI